MSATPSTSALNDAVHDLYRWRGTIVGGLAQFETVLLDLCIQLNGAAQYTGLLKTYPEKPKDMIAHIESLLTGPGFLTPYRTMLETAFREYEIISVDRNLYAHGAMVIDHAGDVPLSLTIHLWHRARPGANRRTEQVLWEDFKRYAEAVADFADRGTASLRAIYALNALPTVTTYAP